MNILCPKCTEVMIVVDRQSIHIDYCPRCHGVFLDRGELEKMIELSFQPVPAYAPPGYRNPPVQPQQRGDGHHEDYDYRYNSKKRRRSFLGDMFDFD